MDWNTEGFQSRIIMERGRIINEDEFRNHLTFNGEIKPLCAMTELIDPDGGAEEELISPDGEDTKMIVSELNKKHY